MPNSVISKSLEEVWTDKAKSLQRPKAEDKLGRRLGLKQRRRRRSLPIYAGGVSLLAVLFNRTSLTSLLVADASSSQSRADLLTLGLAVTNILAGLVWLSIRPKSISKVDPEGVECQRMYSTLPKNLLSELLW
ncbi:hypothetical protein M0R45_022683 [Rubus argutus]|uniref:Uncharacterized protein n=1 Tax=Rubus argutus TaxID=59490 RepID=A0AAW1XGE9_RUBAR